MLHDVGRDAVERDRWMPVCGGSFETSSIPHHSTTRSSTESHKSRPHHSTPIRRHLHPPPLHTPSPFPPSARPPPTSACSTSMPFAHSLRIGLHVRHEALACAVRLSSAWRRGTAGTRPARSVVVVWVFCAGVCWLACGDKRDQLLNHLQKISKSHKDHARKA